MKISNSKKELARIISENGGWKCAGDFAAQCKKDDAISFYMDRPKHNPGELVHYGDYCGSKHDIYPDALLQNWHQTILSRAEYFHLYPVPDADGWIEWTGGECPVGEEQLVRIKVRGETGTARGKAGHWSWGHSGCGSDIIAYRLHKTEQSLVELCGEVKEENKHEHVDAKPTIEQLAADYRNAKDYAERKQQEADAAKADAGEKLRVLEIAGEALGLLVSPITEKQEPEYDLVITDWRDLQLGDIIEYVDGSVKDKIGMTGPVVEFASDARDGLFVRLKCDNGHNKGRLGWPSSWRFIRRP